VLHLVSLTGQKVAQSPSWIGPKRVPYLGSPIFTCFQKFTWLSFATRIASFGRLQCTKTWTGECQRCSPPAWSC